jgi:hypothetical protein
MKARILTPLALAIGLAMANLAVAADLAKLPDNSVITDGIAQFGKARYPLPPGEWTLATKAPFNVVRTESLAGPSRQGLRALLVNMQGGQIRAAMTFTGNLVPFRTNYWDTESDCSANGAAPFRRVIDKSTRYPECVEVNNLVGPPPGGLQVPSTTLVATYLKFSETQYILVRVYVNPETSPQKPASQKEYVDKTAAWLMTLAHSYAAAFKGKAAAPVGEVP